MYVNYAPDYNYMWKWFCSSLVFHGDFILYKNKYLKNYILSMSITNHLSRGK